MKELFPILEPVFFWLANILEFYNFLLTHSASLHLPRPPDADFHPTPDGGPRKEENPITTLHSILVYAYQQAFYPVSKVCMTFKRE